MSPSQHIKEHFHSLRFKITAALILVLTVSIGSAMYGLWIYEKGQFITTASREARHAGHTIEKSLRSAMLTNDRQTIQDVVHEISQLYEPPSRISILNNSGEVKISSNSDFIGRYFDPADSPSCIPCHQGSIRDLPKQPVITNGPGGKYLRNIIKIDNSPACHSCHSPERKYLGVLLYDVNFSGIYAFLKSIAFRMFLTGLITLLVVNLVLFLLINRLIHRPILKILQGFREVGKGNYGYWVYEDSNIEFGDMADQFNVMSQAIGRFVNEIKAKTRETAILYAIVREISETIEWGRLQKIIVDLTNDIFKAESNALVVPCEGNEGCYEMIWRLKGEDRLYHYRYYMDKDEVAFSGINREEILDWQDNPYSLHKFKDNYRRVLIPLFYNMRVMGMICVQKPDGEKFSRHEQAIIPALAKHASISLANSYLYHLAITDGLTDLYSKRYFLNKIEILINRYSVSEKERFFILIMDVDHFKEVNDTYGHNVGDQVLIQLAAIIKRNIRFEDIPFRYGGEEFVVLVPEIRGKADLGVEIAERLRKAVEAHTFEAPETPSIKKTISIGVASFPDNGVTSEALIQTADEALYKAKNRGRNQVCCAFSSLE